jgi:predicted nucleic acid-binding protein
VTASRILFDTWAWWEVLRGSAEGSDLQRRYLDPPGVQVLTSALTLGELSAKLASEGAEDSIPLTVTSVRRASMILELTAELAVEAGIVRSRLRKHSNFASLADAIVLATARQQRARLISRDQAFAGEPDVSAR